MKSEAENVLPKIEMVPLDSIHKNPKNPRIIKDDKFKKLCQSIKEDPWFMRLRPIIYDETGMILGGNMRYEACKFLELKEVPAINANDLTEKQKEKVIIKDNLPGGAWNWEMLADDFEVADLIEWGFDEWELGLGPNPNAPPAADEEEEEKTGGEHTIKKCICPECGHEFEA